MIDFPPGFWNVGYKAYMLCANNYNETGGTGIDATVRRDGIVRLRQQPNR